ncbi:CaiB/BaiF CoA transferase family protein [Thermodesulfobacteriota bacterium]
MSEAADKKGLLDGIKVLEIADEKGQYCGKVLASLGAEVIKIEKPGGDPARKIGPFYKDRPSPEGSLYWWFHNTSKKSITLDLETSDGQVIFKRLIKEVDILLETPSPGVAEGAGLGYEALAEINKGLILGSITNFGKKGPHADYKAPDIVGAAMGVLMSIIGEPDKPPLRPYGDAGFFAASAWASVAVLTALNARDVTGKGQLIEIPMQACIAVSLEYTFPYYAYLGDNLKRMGARLQVMGPGNVSSCYPCKDGYIFAVPMAPPLDWMEEEGMVDDLKEDERLWYDWPYRISKEEHISEVFAPFIKKHTKKEIFDKIIEERSVWMPVHTFEEVATDPHLRERGYFTEVEHPDLDAKIPYPRPPARVRGIPDQMTRAPGIGEHNEEIYLGKLELSREELISLASAGIV